MSNARKSRGMRLFAALAGVLALTLALSGCGIDWSWAPSWLGGGKHLDIAGSYVEKSGKSATVAAKGSAWAIEYQTDEGKKSGEFEAKWESADAGAQRAVATMGEANGLKQTRIAVDYKSPEDIAITVRYAAQGNDYKELTYTKVKPSAEASQYEAVLKGDLTAFKGTFSNDDFNKTIADAGFNYNGFSPDDYYSNRANVFPTITKDGYQHDIVNHENYVLRAGEAPKKVKDYYEVHLYPIDDQDNNGARLTLFLVPPRVKGPDGSVETGKRIFQQRDDGDVIALKYQQPNWWKQYASSSASASSSSSVPLLPSSSSASAPTSGPWSEAKTVQLQGAMDSWAYSMGQAYRSIDLNSSQGMGGAPRSFFNHSVAMMLDGSVVSLTPSRTGNESAANVVAYYEESDGSANQYRYIFVIQGGAPTVYVTDNYQGNTSGTYYWRTSQNSDLQRRFADVVGR